VLARQVTRASGESGAAASALVRLGAAIFFGMNAMMVSLPAYVPAVYGGEGVPIDGPLFQLLRVLALVLTAPVVLLLGGPILASAGRGLRAGVANTDALIVLGTAAAYALSVYHVAVGRPEVYFDTVVMLLVLVTLGRYLEARARADAGETVRRTLAQGPRRARRLAVGPPAADGEAGDGVEEVEVDALRPGDLVRVSAGETFPADGVVVRGSGGVDQSLLTGEHAAVLRRAGDEVAGGSSSIDGDFVVRLSAGVADSTEARIERMLAEARRQRTPAQQLADRVSTVMLPVVTLIAAAAGLYWTLAGDLDRGLLTALAVLCVACPCGLGLATPVALWTALRTAAGRGIVARNPAALERLAGVRRMYFDKTGTLTERDLHLESARPAPGSELGEDELVALAAAVERGQSHPVARALAAHQRRDRPPPPDTAPDRSRDRQGAVGIALERSQPLPDGRGSAAVHDRNGAGVHPVPARWSAVDDVRVVPGLGVSARVDGVRTTVGSLAFARAELGIEVAPLAGAAGTQIAVWQAGRLLGQLALRESARAEAAEALRELRHLGLQPRLLTGDAQASAVVPALLDASEVAVGLLPTDKLDHLRRAQAEAPGSTAMAGDGINDGPALAGADVGIAVGSATDLARTTADVALMTEDLRALPWFVRHARRTRAVIRQNLIWAFGYNGIAVALAAAGALSPLVATLAMIGSSLLVVANSRRLRPRNQS